MINFISAMIAKFLVSAVEGVGLFTGVMLAIEFYAKVLH